MKNQLFLKTLTAALCVSTMATSAVAPMATSVVMAAEEDGNEGETLPEISPIHEPEDQQSAVEKPEASTDLSYNGDRQVIAKGGVGYTLSCNDTDKKTSKNSNVVIDEQTGDVLARDAKSYTVTATLKDGYRWQDGSTEIQVFNVNIARTNINVKAKDQTVGFGCNPYTSGDAVTIDHLSTKDKVESVKFRDYSDSVPGSTLTPESIKIVDAETGKIDRTSNYNITFASGTLKVTKGDNYWSMLDTKEACEMEYTGMPIDTEKLPVKAKYGNIKWTYYADKKLVRKIDTPKFVGTYYAVPTVEASENYNGLTTNEILEIKVVPKTVLINWSNTSLTYNGGRQAPVAKIKNLCKGDTCEVIVSGAQVDANAHGTVYTAKAVGVSNKNYVLDKAGANSINFDIKKASVKVPIVKASSFAYDGKEKVAVEDGQFYVVSNGKGTKAGTYNAVICLTSPTNSTWADGTVAPKTITWTINQSKIAYKVPSTKTVIFNGKYFTPDAVSVTTPGVKVSYGVEANNFKYDRAPRFKSVGTHKIYYMISGDDNFSFITGSYDLVITPNKDGSKTYEKSNGSKLVVFESVKGNKVYTTEYTYNADNNLKYIRTYKKSTKTGSYLKERKYRVNADKTLTLVKAREKSSVSTIKLYGTLKANDTTYVVSGVAKNVMKHASSVTKVELGKNITKINKRAFSNCKNLKTVVVKGKLTYVGKKAFNSKHKVTFKLTKGNFETNKKLILKSKVKKVSFRK